MTGDTIDLPQAIFEPVVSNPIALERLGDELLLCFQDLDGPHEVKTCCGDLLKIINALMDYARLLEMVCDQWNLQGFHRATYEYHADKLRQIAEKYQLAIGYDYGAAMEKCRKSREKKVRDDGVGEDALVLASRKRNAPNDAAPEENAAAQPSPWEDEDAK